jgi:uncharacterized membrane protein YkvA (DUF1232 family)
VSATTKPGWLTHLRNAARALKRELVVLHAAVRDPRTPWWVKGLGLLVIAYALSPIDLIPDFIPVLGLLDDIVLVPLGLMLVKRCLPAPVLHDAQQRVDHEQRLPPNRWAAALIIALWLLSATALLGWWLTR